MSLFSDSSGKVRLTDVTTLTLYRDKYTTGRRSAPIPQIQCVGGSAKGKFEPKVCTEFDDFIMTWKLS